MRAGAQRLALALVLALLVVPGYVVAPVLFSVLDSHAQAGHVAGAIFHISNRGLLFLLLAIAAFWWQREAGRLRWVLLIAVLCLIGTNEFIISPVIQDLKVAMGPIDAVPADDPQRAAFGMWHGVSAIMHLFSSLIAALLVALGSPSGRSDFCKP